MSNKLHVSRRRLLNAGAKGAFLRAAVGIAPKFIRPARAYAADALAAGMIGGPTGFAGSERYQYSANTQEGRAIEAAKKLEASGVDRIVLGLSDGSIGQLAKPFPDGAPPIKDLWEKETGIQVDIVGVPNGQEFTKVMQDISTKAGSFDIYAVEWNRLGDLAETGGILKLDDFVAKYKPEWDDPERGYVGGAKGVALLNQYRGSTYGVCLDGDFQTWVYRTDLFNDPVEQKAFKTNTDTTSRRRRPGSSSTRSRCSFIARTRACSAQPTSAIRGGATPTGTSATPRWLRRTSTCSATTEAR